MIELNNQAVPYRGTIKSKTDTDITIQMDGRLGTITVPWRMVISDNPVQIGEKVHFLLSLFEVKNDTIHA